MINGMLSPQQVRDLVDRRSRRSIALLLSFKEHNADKYLPVEVQEGLRKAIMDEINDLTSLMLDVVSFFQE